MGKGTHRATSTFHTSAVASLQRLITLQTSRWPHATVVQHEQLVKRIMELMWTDPDDLLPEDRALLDEDFEKLGAADANDQAYWVAEIESALKAAQHAFDSERMNAQNSTNSGNQTVRPTTTSIINNTLNTEPSIDTEGSIRYRRRRKK